MNRRFEFLAEDEQDTMRLGAALGKTLPRGAVLGLCGTLGSGKTRLVQAIATACGVPTTTVLSPTFTMCNEYVGDRPIYHLDLYRVADTDELFELGFDEYLETDGITCIEWADRFREMMPDAYLEITIHVTDFHERRFELHATSADYAAALTQLAVLLDNGTSKPEA
jgi:tRNA threonylcarbamoyladenosine biosynthesis protein TsaE